MTRIHTVRHRVFLAAAVVAMLAAPVARAYASNEALLKLLRILRDRGSITNEEYEELRVAASEPASSATSSAPPVAASVPRPAPAPAAAVQAPSAAPDVDAAVKKALTGKWYERISLRGYTQFRFSEVGQGDGATLEVPADRSVNPNESFMIRRGRFIFSGDVTDHLYLYAQSDFNASTGAADFSLQMRDLYADVALDSRKTFRVRLGQSKVPFGFVNLQSSQNRAPLERPDAINSAAEGERDLGAYLMWASPEARRRFRDLVGQGLKGSGDYGVVAVGAFGGQGLNRPDQDGDFHYLARVSYPFKFSSGQFFEIGAQAYRGRFLTTTTAITSAGRTFTPSRPDEGIVDERIGVTAVWYPQPFGVEAEWNFGRGPELSDDWTRIEQRSLQGGYVQAAYRRADGGRSFHPFVRWQYYDGGRKFARNSPHLKVNELDFGVEFARWAELELTMIYTRTFERTRSSTFPFGIAKNANRLGFQAQWNY